MPDASSRPRGSGRRSASAATTIAELEAEIVTLRAGGPCRAVRRSGTNAKWTRLQELLQDTEDENVRRDGQAPELIIFTEHRDTLNYLADRIRTLLGR